MFYGATLNRYADIATEQLYWNKQVLGSCLADEWMTEWSWSEYYRHIGTYLQSKTFLLNYTLLLAKVIHGGYLISIDPILWTNRTIRPHKQSSVFTLLQKVNAFLNNSSNLTATSSCSVLQAASRWGIITVEHVSIHHHLNEAPLHRRAHQTRPALTVAVLDGQKKKMFLFIVLKETLFFVFLWTQSLQNQQGLNLYTI